MLNKHNKHESRQGKPDVITKRAFDGIAEEFSRLNQLTSKNALSEFWYIHSTRKALDSFQSSHDQINYT